MQYLDAISNRQNDLCSFPRQTIQHHSNAMQSYDLFLHFLKLKVSRFCSFTFNSFCSFKYLLFLHFSLPVFFSTDILLSHACKNICTYLLFIGFLRQYWNGLLFIYPVNKLNHKGSPRILEWLYSSACSRPRNRTGVSCIACEFFTNWAIKEAPPVDHSLSEFSTMTHSSWVALHSTAHSFTELEKTFIHVINLISFLWLWFSFGLP